MQFISHIIHYTPIATKTQDLEIVIHMGYNRRYIRYYLPIDGQVAIQYTSIIKARRGIDRSSQYILTRQLNSSFKPFNYIQMDTKKEEFSSAIRSATDYCIQAAKLLTELEEEGERRLTQDEIKKVETDINSITDSLKKIDTVKNIFKGFAKVTVRVVKKENHE